MQTIEQTKGSETVAGVVEYSITTTLDLRKKYYKQDEEWVSKPLTICFNAADDDEAYDFVQDLHNEYMVEDKGSTISGVNKWQYNIVGIHRATLKCGKQIIAVWTEEDYALFNKDNDWLLPSSDVLARWQAIVSQYARHRGWRWRVKKQYS